MCRTQWLDEGDGVGRVKSLFFYAGEVVALLMLASWQLDGFATHQTLDQKVLC